MRPASPDTRATREAPATWDEAADARAMLRGLRWGIPLALGCWAALLTCLYYFFF